MKTCFISLVCILSFNIFYGQLTKQLDILLSNQHVNDVIKSEDGLLWVATQEGLNLFYDDEIKVFFSNIEDSLSILNSDISKLFYGFSNELIAFSKDGISVFNPNSFFFNQIKLKSTPTNLFKDDVNRKIWITTEQSGLYVLNDQLILEKHFEFDPLNPLSVSTSKFNSANNSKIYFHQETGKVFVASQNGLNVFDEKLNTFKRYFKGSKTQLTSNNILSIIPIDKNNVGVLSENEFVFFNINELRFQRNLEFDIPLTSASVISDNISLITNPSQSFLLFLDKNKKYSIKEIFHEGESTIFDRQIYTQNSLYLWRSGYKNIIKTDLNLSEIILFNTQNNINSVKISQSTDDILVGTEDGIENYTDPKKLVNNFNSLKGALYFGVFEKEYIQIFENRIEMGILSNGKKSIIFNKRFPFNFKNSKFEKKEQYLIIANQNIKVFDLFNKNFINNSLEPNDIKNVIVTNIKEIEDFLYLSYDNGIIRIPFNKFLESDISNLKNSLKFYEYNALLNKNSSRGFYDIEKIDNTFYVTDFNKGLSVFENDFGNFVKSYTYNGDSKKTLASSSPTKLFFDKKNQILFIGTLGSGLFMLDLKSETFTSKTVENGLLSNNIYDFSKIEDRLFIQTVSGINYSENGIIKNINLEDGLTINDYHKESIHQIDNIILLTGYDKNQFIEINDISKNQQSFKINCLKVSGLNEQNEESILKITENNSIDFDYNTNTIILDLYASSNYKSDQIKYYFNRISSPQSISNGYNNKIQLSSFPYYTSEVEVYAVNGNNQKSENTLSFKIYNAPPWWLRIETIVFYVIFSIGLVYSFVKLRESQTKKRMESERKSKELEEARELQNSLLPKNNPEVEGYQISTYLKSATEIGGDYYDFFYKKDEYFYAICGDATGHGVISGIMVSVTKAGLNGIPMGSPSKILQKLNRIVKRVNFGRLRMSLTVAKLEKDSIELSSAAMPPTYYYSAKTNKIEEILVPNLPLGGLESEKYDGVKIDFKEGDVIVMISDGLPELPNPNNELLDYEKVEECFRGHSEKDAEGIKNALVELSDEWANGVMNPDDITIVVIKKAA